MAIDGGVMAAVTVSPKYQVVIPKEVREKLGLSPGQRIQVVVYGDRIVLIPVRPTKQMRGFLKGIDTRVDREVVRL
jgi:AbrB family looped-hinge helix DNA binding protein